MKMKFKSVFASLSAFALLGSGFAIAQDVTRAMDAEKKAKIVGEMASGYLGFVKPATQDQIELSRKVNEINSARRNAYAKIANDKGLTIDAVALTTARIQIADKTALGEYFKDQNGVWCAKSKDSIIEAREDGTILIQCK